MTYFSDQTKGQETADTQNQNEDWLNKVVAEKGEQWADPQVLAKGYANAQEYIKHIEQQNKELNEDLSKKSYVEELLAELRKEKGTPPAGAPSKDNGSTEPSDQTGQQVSEDALKGLIEQTLTQREQQNTAAQNLETVDQKLKELFGTEVNRVVDERAKHLGMSKERMKEIASESPTAFLTLIGEAAVKQPNPMKTGSVNTSADAFNQTSGEKNWAYYQKMRREDPHRYRTPQVQREMFEQKLKLGERFGNS